MLIECPNCAKREVQTTGNFPIYCLNCNTEFTEDDMCLECEELVKGSCYHCKMD